MQIIFKSQTRRAYALLVTMTFMAIMLVLFAAMMFNTISNSTITKRNNQYQASEAAAQAASEKILSQMTHDFEFDAFSNNGTYYGTTFLPDQAVDQADWPIKYNYSDESGSNGQVTVLMGTWSGYTVPLTSEFAGLRGYTMNCTNIVTATPTTGPNVPATVTETVQFAEIPLFQFAIFYNMNLEIAAASTLNIAGPVYSNGGIWSGSTTITFSSTVAAVGIATNAANDPFCAGYSGSGASHYTIAGQPTSGNDTLTMPIGTNNDPASVEAIVNIPPSAYAWGSTAASTTNGQMYLANSADLVLTNAFYGTNWGSTAPKCTNMVMYYQDFANASYETWVTNDYYTLKVVNSLMPVNPTNYVPSTQYTNIQYAGYSFLTNVVFYDWREGWHGGSGPAKTVQAVQLDLKKFNIWLTNAAVNGGSNYNYYCCLQNHKKHSINSIYIYNYVPLSATVLPAVRIVNGGMMPPACGYRGFTLATAQPLYIWGDYNASNTLGSSISQNSVTYTEPAGVMADAITVLSDNWSDPGSTKTTGGPTASATTINAACLEGIVPSTSNSASDAEGYSGGVENFLRLLENWSSKNLYYNGSIIVMFPSQFATNCWQQTGGYYTAASRQWAFDTNFNTDQGLPPLTPQSQGVIRGSWSVN